MATKIPVNTIIALILVAIMVLVGFGFFSTLLFGGPEFDAAKNFAEELEYTCTQNAPFATTPPGIFLPDSKQGFTHKYYFYIALENYQVILRSRPEATEPLAAFVDFVVKPGDITLRTIDLKTCKAKNVQICFLSDTEPKCNNFQFEASEGKEYLAFTMNRTKIAGEKVLLSYTKISTNSSA